MVTDKQHLKSLILNNNLISLLWLLIAFKDYQLDNTLCFYWSVVCAISCAAISVYLNYHYWFTVPDETVIT